MPFLHLHLLRWFGGYPATHTQPSSLERAHGEVDNSALTGESMPEPRHNKSEPVGETRSGFRPEETSGATKKGAKTVGF